MAKVSVIIPCRGETYQVAPGVSVLQRMIDDIYEKATGEFEVIVVFDGPPYQPLPHYPNLIVEALTHNGTKIAVNRGAAIATGDYLFKLDAHCMVCPGFDQILVDNMEDNWVVMPRFYTLDAENWKWQDERFYDYFSLPCPFTYKRGFMFQAGGHWGGRTKERLEIGPMDENMKLHGSGWFMARKFFWENLEGLDPSNGAGSWNGEDIEIGMKTWLGPWDGKLMVNKSAWFAHMHRGGQRPREYGVSWHETYNSAKWTADYWMNNCWDRRAHDIKWLIDKFWPVPGWPENWKELMDARAG